MDDIEEVALALGSTSTSTRDEALAPLRDDADALAAVVEHLTKRLSSQIASVGEDDDAPDDLDALLLALGTVAPLASQASEALRAAARHGAASIRSKVATWGRGPAIGEIRLGLLDDADEDVAAAALRHVGAARDPGAVDKLLGLARKASPGSRGDWLEALGACGSADPARGAEIAEFLASEARGDKRVVASALTALILLGAPAATQADALRSLANETDPRIRLRAHAALGGAGVDAALHLDAVVDALASDDEDERASAATALRELPEEREATILRAALARKQGAERARILARLASQNRLLPHFGLDEVLAHIGDPSGAVRAAVVDAVPRYVHKRREGPPLAQLTPDLRAQIDVLASDADGEVREAVTRAKKKLG